MSEELNNGAPSTTAPPTTEPTQPSGHIDPDDYAALQAQVAQYQTAFERLNPQATRIQRLMEDPQAAEIFDKAVESFEALKKQQGPQVPEDQKPLYEKVSRLEQMADDYFKQQRDAAEAPQRQYAQKWNDWQHDAGNERFYNKMVRENPDLTNKDMVYLATVAAEQDFIPLEEVWKKESWRFVKPSDQRTTPPSSLRSDAGEVGIPGESKNGAPDKSMRDRIVELERARMGRAS